MPCQPLQRTQAGCRTRLRHEHVPWPCRRPGPDLQQCFGARRVRPRRIAALLSSTHIAACRHTSSRITWYMLSGPLRCHKAVASKFGATFSERHGRNLVWLICIATRTLITAPQKLRGSCASLGCAALRETSTAHQQRADKRHPFVRSSHPVERILSTRRRRGGPSLPAPVPAHSLAKPGRQRSARMRRGMT